MSSHLTLLPKTPPCGTNTHTENAYQCHLQNLVQSPVLKKHLIPLPASGWKYEELHEKDTHLLAKCSFPFNGQHNMDS
ncbi:hypothetical protein CEXT_332991 [Caerostris extrusa]|uniref:Uncharacterized protein n=1 Tax=Caerostris extrusa TaxID=172846 RepID=A0AAV4TNL3_CAEEX|nr:hypothetical protein CEXT_332991 [Caerostris extrusa]